MFYEFEISRITLKFFLRMFLRTCETVSVKLCINREDKIMSSKFIYTVIFVTRKTNFLDVATPTSIYNGCSTWNTFWKYNLTPVNMISYGSCNVRKHKEIKNSEQYIVLEFSLKLDCLYKMEFTS